MHTNPQKQESKVYMFTFGQKTMQIRSTELLNHFRLFDSLNQYFQHFIRIKGQSEYTKDNIISANDTEIEFEKSLPMIEYKDKIYIFKDMEELEQFYKERGFQIDSIIFHERKFNRSTTSDEISDYAKENYIFDYHMTIAASKIIINIEFKIDGKPENIEIFEVMSEEEKIEKIKKEYYNNCPFIHLNITDDNTVNAKICIQDRSKCKCKEKLKNREITVKEFLDEIKDKYELKNIEHCYEKSLKSKIIELKTDEDCLTIKNLDFIRLNIFDKMLKVSNFNTIGKVLENIFPGDSESKYFITSGKIISDKNQLAFKFADKKLKIFDFKKNSIAIEINCKYFNLYPIQIDTKNLKLLESSRNIINEIINRSKINRNPNYLEIKYNGSPLIEIVITKKMRDEEGNVVIPLDVTIKKAPFILKVNDDEDGTYHKDFINEKISSLSKEFKCDKIKLYDIDNSVIDDDKTFLYLTPEKEYRVEMLDIHSFILPKSKESKEKTLELELIRFDTFEHALSLHDETKDIPYLVFNDKKNITKDKITGKKDKPLNLKINYKFVDIKTKKDLYIPIDELYTNVLKFIVDKILNTTEVERIESYFMINNNPIKAVKFTDTFENFDYKKECAFHFKLLPFSVEQQLNNRIKELESLLERKETECKTQLEIKEMKYNEQLESKDKEIEELRQKNKNLEKKIHNEKNTLSKKIENSKKIQILDSQDIKKYEIEEEIGSGSSGKVLKVFMKQYYALKIMKTEDTTVENIRHFIGEYEIMNLLNHPNILKTFGIFFSDEKMPPSILLEYCQHNLKNAIKNKSLSPVQLVCAIYQIAEGMKYIHFRKIIHRDLKPLNILIAEDGTIKISDFGISKLMTPEEFSMTIGVGTNKFMAPEIIAEEDDYNEKVDVYSFGVLMFYMISGGELPKIKTPQILKGMKAEIPSNFT